MMQGSFMPVCLYICVFKRRMIRLENRMQKITGESPCGQMRVGTIHLSDVFDRLSCRKSLADDMEEMVQI